MHTIPISRLASSMLGLVALAGIAVGAEHDFEHRVPADPKGTVVISDVISGNVRITGWDRDEVEVLAAFDEHVERVDVRRQGRRTTIKLIVPKGFGSGASANLFVRIPQGSDLEVATTSGDIDSRAVLGSQKLKTVSGNVRAEVADGNTDIHSISGAAIIRGSGQPVRLRVTTVSGDIHIDDIAGEFEVTAISGDIRVNGGRVTRARVRTTSGNYDFQGVLEPRARFEAESVSGDLEIRAESGKGYDYDIVTFSGDIRSCFDREPERTSAYGPGKRLSGRLGEGSAEVDLKTMSGNIDLCR